MTVTPFRIQVPQSDIDDLAARLAVTRWPDEPSGSGADYGMPLPVVQRLAEQWRTGYDWRAHEARLNEIPQFTTVIDGQRIHFLHVRSAKPGALPLLLLHGWPGSVVEFTGLIGLLTDFDLVIPSLPGYGFSGPTTERGWDSARMARAFAELMPRLGYQRWGAVGGDTGALVGRELGILAPDSLIGVHLLQVFAFPTGDPAELAKMSEADTASLSGMTAEFQDKAGYQKIQQTRPNTLGYGLTDSPVLQLAWNAELWTGWGEYADRLDTDVFLTHASIYWYTRTGVSSARHYYEDSHSGAGYRDLPNKVPTAIAVFPWDFRTIKVLAERSNNVVRYTEFERGGHFAFTTDPDLVAEDVRQFFTSLG